MAISKERIRREYPISSRETDIWIPVDKIRKYDVMCLRCDKHLLAIKKYLRYHSFKVKNVLKNVKLSFDIWLVAKGWKYETPRMYIDARRRQHEKATRIWKP